MTGLLILCFAGGVALLISPYLRRDSTMVRFCLIALSFAVTVRYGLWRASKLPDFGATMYAACAYGFFWLEGIATYLSMNDLYALRRTKNRTAEVENNLDWHVEAAPRIDILIATYNESWEVLEKTIVGALGQNYSNYHVWLLDDGRREWLSEKAAEHGIGYIARTNNAHYKAGNLNHGIETLRARGHKLEFLALLDADFIARPEFLRRSIALMKTPDVGIVQTPQNFYNPDPHQQVFGGVKLWPDEQRGWFDVYLPALDALGWASCCGTSCLIRMEALDAIGGFPIVSVCEDTLSSFEMNKKGYRTVFLQERLTVGLAPEGIVEFLTQRARWLLGGVQNGRHCGAAPGIRGRVNYWLNLWRSAIWGIMPPLWIAQCIVYWFTGAALIKVETLDEAVSYFGPIWLVRLFLGWLFAGRQQPLVSDGIWLLLAPLWVKETTRAIMGSKARFKVTDKAQHRARTIVHWSLLPFHGALALLLITGLLYGLLDPTSPTYADGIFQANTWLTTWFLLVLFVAIRPVIEAPKRRQGDRYETSETVVAMVRGERVSWRCHVMSLGGLAVRTDGCESPAEVVELVVHDVGCVQVEFVRSLRPGLAAFAFKSPEARPALIRKLYCSEDYIVTPARWGLSGALWGFSKRLLF